MRRASREELLERAVERHDLAEDGTRDVPLIAGTARIVVTGATVALTYIDPDGKPRKSVPAALKDGPDGEVLAVLREELKGIRRQVRVCASAGVSTYSSRNAHSNRFAAHIFRQIQARAPMRGRGWSSTPLAWWDDGIDHGVAKRSFDAFGLSAQFFFDPITDVDPSGDLYPFVTSDQVRFDDAEGETLPLADIPRRVFTEALRDVDLFIGVTSIGADPEWLDHGEARQFDTYWQSYSFGDLSAAGQVRRDVLERLVPMLAIRDRCTLEDRFLTVRGQLRNYKIHLGSGNILMSPDDRYLCIVAARSPGATKVFLPFDDDPVLSMVLSKAFLLAADDKITDATINEQIRR